MDESNKILGSSSEFKHETSSNQSYAEKFWNNAQSGKYELAKSAFLTILSLMCQGADPEDDHMDILMDNRFNDLSSTFTIPMLEEANELYPDDVSTREGLLDLYKKDKQLDKYDKLLRSLAVKEGGLSMQEYIQFLKEQGKEDEILPLLQTSVADNPSLRRLLSDRYIESGNYKEAAKIYEQLFSEDIVHADRLIEILEESNNQQKVVDVLKKTIDTMKASSLKYSVADIRPYKEQLAAIYIKQKEVDKAILVYQSLIDELPPSQMDKFPASGESLLSGEVGGAYMRLRSKHRQAEVHHFELQQKYKQKIEQLNKDIKN